MCTHNRDLMQQSPCTDNDACKTGSDDCLPESDTGEAMWRLQERFSFWGLRDVISSSHPKSNLRRLLSYIPRNSLRDRHRLGNRCPDH